ncbi:MAG: HAD family hydrolase [Fusicatenibacter sp.]|nr:HAD family hydrolase [Fusicatenibacter sp.]
MTDGIIFDVDGTLWDSTEIVAKAWNRIIAAETSLSPNLTGDRLKGLFGRILPDIAAILFSGYEKKRQLELIDHCCQEEHRALLDTPAEVYPGLAETLLCLSVHYPLFIVSNCQAGYIEVFLQGTGLGCYFTDHLCPGDTGRAKAANILEIVQKHHLRFPVYVGDTDGDHQACLEAGVPFVHAAYGFGKTENPNYVIQKPKDLLDLFPG